MTVFSKMFIFGISAAALAYAFYQIMDDEGGDIRWSKIGGSESVTKFNSYAQLQTFIAENPSVLICFYAPWCRYCESLMPTFCSVGNILRREGSPIRFGAFNCTKFPEARTLFNVTGYPTINYFLNGNLVGEFAQYRSERNLYLFAKYPPNNAEDLLIRFTSNPFRQ